MRSIGLSSGLRTAFAEFVEAAAALLQADVAAGAEVPFELASYRGRVGARATLYCYQPLTRTYIAERQEQLARLPQHAAAADVLEGLQGLDGYLASRGAAPEPELGPAHITAADLRPGPHIRRAPGEARATVALRELLADVFEGQSDFDQHPERVAAALDRLARAALAGENETITLVATLYGLTIASQELVLAPGLTVAVADALSDVPEAARAGTDELGEHLVVALVLQTADGSQGPAAGDHGREAATIARGHEVLRELLRALRLFGDGRVSFGPLGWVRSGGEDSRWRPLALGAGGRPHGMLVVTAEQEDELRAFCELVSSRAPHADRLAWALRRFELGCERASDGEGLSDHLLALRALLEPEGPASGLLAARVAALCAKPAHRTGLIERITRALELERAVIAGGSGKRAHEKALARDVADHLRALLRDVICGHLDPELAALADRLLVAEEQSPDEQAPAQEVQPAKS
jgi:hypothetical protein